MRVVNNYLIVLFLLLYAGITIANSDFPLRVKYPGVSIFSAEQLKKEYENVIIVDVRTRFEFSVVRINKAVNNPVMFLTFILKLKKLRSQNSEKKIVFYCNGHTCSKSYRAAEKAQKAGFKNVYAYDAGIFSWVKKYPELSTLLDRSPAHAVAIIKKKTLAAKMLEYKLFKAQSQKSNSVVIDIRDPKQRLVLLSLKSRNVYLDKLVGYLNAGVWKNRQLLIYDDVGKQVRWLQYVLQKNGYTNYYFLNKGARGTDRRARK